MGRGVRVEWRVQAVPVRRRRRGRVGLGELLLPEGRPAGLHGAR